MKFSEGSELVRFHGCESPTAWEGLYQNYDDWKRIVCRESYSHPAKMSPVLCEKIFEHLELLNLIDHETSTVVDFMSGTATTNIIAGIRGYRSVSVELEPRFVRMQMKNREGLAAYTGREPDWKIMQGDARNLSKMFNGEDGRAGDTSPPYYGAEIDGGEDWFKVHHPKDGSRPPGMANTVTARYSKGNIAKLPGKLAITSPPYGQGLTRMKDGKLTGKIAAYFTPELLRKSGYETSNLQSKGQIQNLPVKLSRITSPPYADIGVRHNPPESYGDMWKNRGPGLWRKENRPPGESYNRENSRNIGNLGIISPPYANRFDRGNEAQKLKPGTMQNKMDIGGYSLNRKNIGNTKMRAGNTSPPYFNSDNRNPSKSLQRDAGLKDHDYGHSKGQLGNLGIVSPPYQNMTSSPRSANRAARLEKAGLDPESYMGRTGRQLDMDIRYSSSAENVGNQAPEDYSSAMLKVYSEARKAGISPLVTVTKNPTRKGKLVRLDLMMADLLVRAGYEIFDYHQATLVNIQKEREITLDFSEPSERTTAKGRLGFFKRLQLQKGGLVATHEDVIFASIPN